MQNANNQHKRKAGNRTNKK